MDFFDWHIYAHVQTHSTLFLIALKLKKKLEDQMRKILIILSLLSSSATFSTEGIVLQNSHGARFGVIHCIDGGSDLNAYLGHIVKGRTVESVTVNRAVITIQLTKKSDTSVGIKRIDFDELNSIVTIERASFDEECSFSTSL